MSEGTKALTIRFKEKDFARMMVMKERYERVAQVEISINKFIQDTSNIGEELFLRIASEYYNSEGS